jgi:hypothetical protein
MRVYTNHKTSIDHETPIPAGKKMSPLTQLYGVHGKSIALSMYPFIDSLKNSSGIISSQVKDQNLKKREKQWKSRLLTTENLEQTKRKEILQSKKSNEGFKCQDSLPKSSSSSPHLLSDSNSPQHFHHSTHSLPLRKSSRTDDPEMSENDRIANGTYYLSPEQLQTFQDFAALLASFDNFDQVRLKVVISISYGLTSLSPSVR